MYALCYASGQIQFRPQTDDFMELLPILKGPKKAVMQAIRGTARLARDNETYLVPGLPELCEKIGDFTVAPDQEKSIDRLREWINFHKKYWESLGCTVY